MTFKLGYGSKTERPSRNRILFICLVFSVVLFVFAAHVEWVPYLNSSSSSENSTKVQQDKPLHTGSTAPPTSNVQNESNDPSKESSQLDGNKEHNPFLTMFPPRPPAEGEQFLGYLPHSGFHNQLITLQNALRLAAYLNRTLLLPPLYLSHKREALVWKEPPALLLQWADRNKTNVAYCRDIDTSTWHHKTEKELEAMTEEEKKTGRECSLYHSWTMAPWTYFYNIPKLLTGVVGVGNQNEPIRVFGRPVMSLEWLAEYLDIKDSNKDIYFVNDTVRYAYRIVDDSETDYGVYPGSENQVDEQELYPELTPKQIAYMHRYENELLLTDLQRRPEKVLHFGSLFASDRVDARSVNHKALKDYISKGMNLWNQGIIEATTAAEKQIEAWIKETNRAAPGFLSVHLRTEDAIFEKLIPRNLGRIVAWLGQMEKQDRKYLQDNGQPEIVKRAEGTPAAPEKDKNDPKNGGKDDIGTEKGVEDNTDDPAIDPETTSLTPSSEDSVLAPTDGSTTTPTPSIQSPSTTLANVTKEDTAPTFLERCRGAPPGSPMNYMATDVHRPRHSPLLQEFLSQFPCTMFLADFPESVAVLDRIHSPLDGVHMLEYMIALMDANLAAKGREFLGTEHSTFSAYITNHLWPEYHPGRVLEEPEYSDT
ncbi:hypothetical protein BGZ65_003638 [Modicella reniformis]|uniref:O-fucosyltransferase family protein n=1 Tax=Modicella reniformis TaxID=1440133 RepID=A0A9P6M985_9FUNG|nr:hypothetical protein BGZ65_003638 [Modicella reniformis]